MIPNQPARVALAPHVTAGVAVADRRADVETDQPAAALAPRVAAGITARDRPVEAVTNEPRPRRRLRARCRWRGCDGLRWHRHTPPGRRQNLRRRCCRWRGCHGL